MEYIAENAGLLPVSEFVRAVLLRMADQDECEWRNKVQAFRTALREMEEYKLAAYTEEELQHIEDLGHKSFEYWTDEHRYKVHDVINLAASCGFVASIALCKCSLCERGFHQSYQEAEDRALACARRMRATAATLCRPHV